jgi:hypothetical protein
MMIGVIAAAKPRSDAPFLRLLLADKGTDLRTMQDYLRHRDPKHTALSRCRTSFWGALAVGQDRRSLTRRRHRTTQL